MANQHANEARHNTAARRHRQVDQERLKRANQRADSIRHENHFNSIKMHYKIHFASHVMHFGSISMYSTEIGELTHKEQIKDSYRRSNKNQAPWQIEYCDLMEEMPRFIKQTAADDPRLPTDPTQLGLLPVERFTQLEIPDSDFHEADNFQIHQASCTGTMAFCNGGARNDWVWVQTGGDESYGDLRGSTVAPLLALFLKRYVLSEAAGVHWLALVRVLDLINCGRFHLASGHIWVCKRSPGRDMPIVGIGAVIGLAHVITSGERQWIVNYRIDLRTFNDIYSLYLALFGMPKIQ